MTHSTAGGRTATKTMHFEEGRAAVEGYVSFCFFSFTDGKLHLGQCESVPSKDLEAYRAALARNGRTPGSYRYVNGKAIFVDRAALAKTGGAK